MELKIYNPTLDNALKHIDWNFEELKKEVTEKANVYKSLVYTDENIKEAKADRATLNKFSKALNDGKKDVKKMMLEPYSVFEGQVKELIAIVDEANANIDSQVKAYDQKKREEKLIKVEEIYDRTFASAEELKEILTFKRVFKESYLNVTTTLKSITNDMEHMRDSVRHDLEVINAETGEYQFEMKQKYIETLNITEALMVKQTYEENARRKAEYEARRKAELEERQAREKAEAEKLAEAGKKEPEQKQESVSQTVEEEAQEERTEENQEEKTHTIVIRVCGTGNQLNALGEFLTKNNIKYEQIQ